MSIKDHGGQFGGGASKKMFHKYESHSLPLVKSRSTGHHGMGDSVRYKDIYIMNAWNQTTSTMNLMSYDKDLNVIASVGSWRDYSTLNGMLRVNVISQRLGKLVTVRAISGSYGLDVRDVSEQGAFSNLQQKTLGSTSSMVQDVILDEDTDLVYCVWNSTLYCFDLKGFTSSSNPVWTAPVTRPVVMEKVGSKLLFFTGTQSLVYNLTGSGASLHVSTSVRHDTGASILSDGTNVYTLMATGVVSKLDLDLNVIAQSNAYLNSNPTGVIGRSYDHPTTYIGLLFIDGDNLYLRSQNTIIVLNKNTLSLVDERYIMNDFKTSSAQSSVIFDEYRSSPFYDQKGGELIGPLAHIIRDGSSTVLAMRTVRLKLKY